MEIRLDFTELTRAERMLTRAHADQVPFATAQALNDCARAASAGVNRAMAEIFDRPTAFTSRAAVAPRELAATKSRAEAVVTMRPIQAKYLQAQEEGGTRTPATNTRKVSKSLVLPGKAMGLDAYGNIPAGELRRLRQRAKAVGRAKAATKAGGGKRSAADPIVFLPGTAKINSAKISGYFRRTGRKLSRLTAFIKETHYQPRLGYHERVKQIVEATWPTAMARRLAAAIATSRR